MLKSFRKRKSAHLGALFLFGITEFQQVALTQSAAFKKGSKLF